MKKSIIILLVALLVSGIGLVGCGSKGQQGAAEKLTKEEQKVVDFMLNYVWTDPSTSKESAKNIGDSIKARIDRQPWSGDEKLFVLGDWEVDKFDKDVYFVKVMVTPNAKAWAKAGKKTRPPTEAVWRVDLKQKKVFAINPESGFLSWVEK